MPDTLTLISHALCPYVQRAAIVLLEKNVPFDRVTIDLADKPDWFRAASPLGKVPLLKLGGDRYLFESAPIVEFLDETEGSRLHPEDPAERARHRAYIEFASQILNGIGALYNARDDTGFMLRVKHFVQSSVIWKVNLIRTVPSSPAEPFRSSMRLSPRCSAISMSLRRS